MALNFDLLTLYLLVTLCSSVIHVSSSVAPDDLVNCDRTYFNATWADVPPYTYQFMGRGPIKGSIYAVAKSIVETCCGRDVRINMVKRQLSQRALEEEMGDVDMALPVVKTALTLTHGTIDGYMFLPLMETTGGVLLVHKDSLQGNPISTSLLGCWPLAVIILISAFTAGIIIWALDQYWNPGDFPKSFLKGGWEGIWWAFVTMTTVGYGDKTPKSIPARVFGLIWMFIGIIVMSIFTATLTSALTSSQGVEMEIKGSSVGVRRGTIEQIVASREGARITMFDKFGDMLRSVVNRTLDGALVDINFALYNIEQIEEQQIDFGPDVKYAAVFGIMIQNLLPRVEQCFAKYASKSQFDAYDALLSHLGMYEKRVSQAGQESTQSAMSDLNYIILGLGVTLVGICCVCLAWDCLYVRPRRKKMRSLGTSEDTKSRCGGSCTCDENANTVDTGLGKDSQTANESQADKWGLQTVNAQQADKGDLQTANEQKDYKGNLVDSTAYSNNTDTAMTKTKGVEKLDIQELA